MPKEKISKRIKNRIESGSRDIYGTIIILAMIVSFEHYDKQPIQMLISIISALLVIAIAETYVIYQKKTFYKKARLSKSEFKEIIKHELHILYAAEVPIGVYLLFHFNLISLDTFFLLIKVLGILSLFCFSLVIERAMKHNWFLSISHAALASLIGVAIVMLKYFVK